MSNKLEEASATMERLATLERDLPQMVADAAKASKPKLVAELKLRQTTIGDELFEARQEFFTLSHEDLLQKTMAAGVAEIESAKTLTEAKQQLAVVQKAVDLAQTAYQSSWFRTLQLNSERLQVAENLRRLKVAYELSVNPDVRVDWQGNPMPQLTPTGTIGEQVSNATRQPARHFAGMDVNAGRKPHPRHAG